MKFIWTDFGVLDGYSYDLKGNLFVHNTKNESRQMSSKYNSIFNQIEQKCEVLQGNLVQIRTSQNTNSWDPLEWFSDISLSGTEVDSSASSYLKIENPFKTKDKVQTLILERDRANLRAEEAIEREQKAIDQANIAIEQAEHATDQAKQASDQANRATESEYDAIERARAADIRSEAFEAEKEQAVLNLDMLMAEGESKFLEYKTSFSLDVNKIKYKKD